MPFDLNGDFIEESVMFEKSITDPFPCLLLNPDVPLHAINALERTYYIVEVEHEGEMYKAILLEYYRVRVEDVNYYDTSLNELKNMGETENLND